MLKENKVCYDVAFSDRTRPPTSKELKEMAKDGMHSIAVFNYMLQYLIL